ncbi:MAG: hypothetical protein AB7G06_04390 [Bdellovibrionales bacterium]
MSDDSYQIYLEDRAAFFKQNEWPVQTLLKMRDTSELKDFSGWREIEGLQLPVNAMLVGASEDLLTFTLVSLDGVFSRPSGMTVTLPNGIARALYRKCSHDELSGPL